MKKILLIENCGHCRNYLLSIWNEKYRGRCCYGGKSRDVPHGVDIPEWCPLETAEDWKRIEEA